MGDMGVSITYFSVTFFFLFYLTDIIGLSSLLAGTAFFIGKFWDGINDPFMGWISDRTDSKYGRKRVYLIYGAVPFALSFFLLWLIPINISAVIQFLLAILLLFLFGTFYTVITVPYFALVPLLSDNYDERTQITSIRAMLSIVGTIFGGVIALLISSFNDQLIGLRVVGAVFGFIAALAIYAVVISSRGVEQREREREISEVQLQQYYTLVRDKQVLILLLLKFIGAIGTGILSATIPYYAKYILGNESYSTYGLAIYILVGAFSIPIWSKLATKWDKRMLLLVGNLLVALVLAGIAFFVVDLTMFFVGTALLGIAMASYLFIPYSFIPDLVEYYQVEYGERHESIFFGLWMSSHQLGIAFAGLILGIFFELFGYDGKALAQTDYALLAIKISFGLLPGVFLILAAVIIQYYSITKETYYKLQEQLSFQTHA